MTFCCSISMLPPLAWSSRLRLGGISDQTPSSMLFRQFFIQFWVTSHLRRASGASLASSLWTCSLGNRLLREMRKIPRLMPLNQRCLPGLPPFILPRQIFHPMEQVTQILHQIQQLETFLLVRRVSLRHQQVSKSSSHHNLLLPLHCQKKKEKRAKNPSQLFLLVVQLSVPCWKNVEWMMWKLCTWRMRWTSSILFQTL